MVDLVITASSVIAGSNAIRRSGTAGEGITSGQAVYKDPATRKLMKADSNAAAAEARHPVGIALNSGALNQPIAYQTGGDITIGAALTAGLAYYLSDTPGGICPVADVGAGEFVCLIGLAKSTTVLAIGIQSSGVSL